MKEVTFENAWASSDQLKEEQNGGFPEERETLPRDFDLNLP